MSDISCRGKGDAKNIMSLDQNKKGRKMDYEKMLKTASEPRGKDVKTIKIYTIGEAIEELEAIRKEAMRLSDNEGDLAYKNLALSSLVSELASVMGWFARHIDQLEAGLYSEEPPELLEVGKLHAEWDGKSPHPYGCDGKDDDTFDKPDWGKSLRKSEEYHEK